MNNLFAVKRIVTRTAALFVTRTAALFGQLGSSLILRLNHSLMNRILLRPKPAWILRLQLYQSLIQDFETRITGLYPLGTNLKEGQQIMSIGEK
jgi:hypothetical protein